MFDPFLFARCLSQSLQACLIVAFCASWARATGRTGVVNSIGRGVMASVPVTAGASWLFGQTSYQARWEAALATIALCLSAWFTLTVWTSENESEPRARREPRAGVLALCAIGTTIIVVRQMMEIGVVLKAAIFDVRSIPAILTI